MGACNDDRQRYVWYMNRADKYKAEKEKAEQEHQIAENQLQKDLKDLWNLL